MPSLKRTAEEEPLEYESSRKLVKLTPLRHDNFVTPPTINFARSLLGFNHMVGHNRDNKRDYETLCAHPNCPCRALRPPPSFMNSRVIFDTHLADRQRTRRYSDMMQVTPITSDPDAIDFLKSLHYKKKAASKNIAINALVDVVPMREPNYTNFLFGYGCFDSSHLHMLCSPYNAYESRVLDVSSEMCQYYPNMWSTVNSPCSAKWFSPNLHKLVEDQSLNDFPRYTIKVSAILPGGQLFVRHLHLWTSTNFNKNEKLSSNERSDRLVNPMINFLIYQHYQGISNWLGDLDIPEEFGTLFDYQDPEDFTSGIVFKGGQPDNTKAEPAFNQYMFFFLVAHKVHFTSRVVGELFDLYGQTPEMEAIAEKLYSVAMVTGVNMHFESLIDPFSARPMPADGIAIYLHSPSSKCAEDTSNFIGIITNDMMRDEPKAYSLFKNIGIYSWATHAIFCSEKCKEHAVASRLPIRGNYNLEFEDYLALPYPLRKTIGFEEIFTDVFIVTQH